MESIGGIGIAVIFALVILIPLFALEKAFDLAEAVKQKFLSWLNEE